MAGKLARVSTSNDNIIQLDRVRPPSPGRRSADPNLCPDLCTDFSTGAAPRKTRKSKKKELTPALIDDFRVGKLDDSKTVALSIEVLPSGKKRWLFRRRITGRGVIVKLSLGLYPAYSIADAREWANGLNLQIDAGIDPRETARQNLRLATMTVERAHELYMEAVREGRSSRMGGVRYLLCIGVKVALAASPAPRAAAMRASSLAAFSGVSMNGDSRGRGAKALSQTI